MPTAVRADHSEARRVALRIHDQDPAELDGEILANLLLGQPDKLERANTVPSQIVVQAGRCRIAWFARVAHQHGATAPAQHHCPAQPGGSTTYDYAVVGHLR